MVRVSLTVLASRGLLIAGLLLAMNACGNSPSVYEEEQKKDEYLKSNFPAKKQGKTPETPVKTTFDR